MSSQPGHEDQFQDLKLPNLKGVRTSKHQLLMSDPAGSKRGQFHHTRLALTLPGPRQRQSISTKHTLGKRGTVKMNTAKNHVIQDSYESHLVSSPSHYSAFRPRSPCFCFSHPGPYRTLQDLQCLTLTWATCVEDVSTNLDTLIGSFNNGGASLIFTWV